MRMRSWIRVALIAAACVATGVGCFTPRLQEDEPAEKLTVGTVQRELKVGMDQASVIEILGSPNMVTTDAERRENWVYDKISTSKVDAQRGIGGSIIIFGGSESLRERSTTQRTLTIIVKFDHDQKVRDFAYNYTQF